jgi:hypothetical protein
MVVTELGNRASRGGRDRLDAPVFLDRRNAAAAFNDPIKAHTGLVLLTHQLGYFNMRPLYVVLIVRSLDLNPAFRRQEALAKWALRHLLRCLERLIAKSEVIASIGTREWGQTKT